MRCSNCHERGHNKRRYNQARRHTSNSEQGLIFRSETEAEIEEQEEEKKQNYAQARAEIFQAIIKAENKAKAEGSG